MRIVGRPATYLQVALAASLLGSCSLESPISVTDRPLAEQLEDRAAQSSNEDERLELAETPERLAFADAPLSGELVRLNVTNDGRTATLRSGPGSAYDTIAEIPGGAQVLATGSRTGEWIHVLYADFDGWLSEQRVVVGGADGQIEFVDQQDVERSVVTYIVIGEAVGVNIRSEPNAGAELVSGAAVGSELTGTGNTEGTWVEVVYDGVTGWASGNYLEPQSNADE